MSTYADTCMGDNTCDDFTEVSSTDAGEDIAAVYVDFDDAGSCSSDGETTSEVTSKPTSPSQAAAKAAACMYSVMMLLRFRDAVFDDDDDVSSPVRYSTRSMSDLPAPSPKKVTRTETPPSPASGPDACSWRVAPMALPEATEDSWLAQQRKREATGTPDDDANVVRAARSILNKLTVEKFESLFEQLTMCGIKQPHHISILMREVFEKATTQHHFIPMYAELCVQLEKDPRIAAVVEDADQLQDFRRLLLNQCQHVFEQLLESCGADVDVDEESVFRRKQEALGNMKLIGHLLVHGMLSPNLFTECCQELLSKRTQCPEALESLVALVMVAAPKFDFAAWQYFGKLENIFLDMNALTKDKSVPPRLRFLIRDVLDARNAGWPSSLRGKAPAKLEECRNAVVTAPAAQKPEPEKEAPVPITPPWRMNATDKKKKSVQFEAQQPEVPAPPVPEVVAFNVVSFRRTLATVFSDLASDKNIPGAVQRIREEKVPAAEQADQFVDILTRIVEERRGAVRRCELAFLAGLGAAESSAFERKECLAGIGLFFKGVYPELCDEVHRLPAIMKSEFMPTVLTVFDKDELNKVVPISMRK